jgi:hypothetical protein
LRKQNAAGSRQSAFERQGRLSSSPLANPALDMTASCWKQHNYGLLSALRYACPAAKGALCDSRPIIVSKSEEELLSAFFLIPAFEILDDFIPTKRPEGVRILGNPLP